MSLRRWWRWPVRRRRCWRLAPLPDSGRGPRRRGRWLPRSRWHRCRFQRMSLQVTSAGSGRVEVAAEIGRADRERGWIRRTAGLRCQIRSTAFSEAAYVKGEFAVRVRQARPYPRLAGRAPVSVSGPPERRTQQAGRPCGGSNFQVALSLSRMRPSVLRSAASIDPPLRARVRKLRRPSRSRCPSTLPSAPPPPPASDTNTRDTSPPKPATPSRRRRRPAPAPGAIPAATACSISVRTSASPTPVSLRGGRRPSPILPALPRRTRCDARRGPGPGQAVGASVNRRGRDASP